MKQHSTNWHGAQEVTESFQFKSQGNKNGIWQHTKPLFPPTKNSEYNKSSNNQECLHSATV